MRCPYMRVSFSMREIQNTVNESSERKEFRIFDDLDRPRPVSLNLVFFLARRDVLNTGLISPLPTDNPEQRINRGSKQYHRRE